MKNFPVKHSAKYLNQLAPKNADSPNLFTLSDLGPPNFQFEFQPQNSGRQKMDSEDDFHSSSPSKQLSPQVQFRRLKRLKKSDEKLAKDPSLDLPDDPVLYSHIDFAKLEALENDSEPQIFEESNSMGEAHLSQESLSQGVENEVEIGGMMELGLDVQVKKTKRVLEFVDDVVGGSDESGAAISEDGEKIEPEKKERIGEEDLVKKKEEKKKRKKKSEKNVSSDELKTNSRDTSKRKEKERKAYLAELHAESQRLLRERGDASFKPIPVVQKPISSVLEKIRKRKLEISKKSMTANDNNHGFERNIGREDGLMELDRSDEEREENAAITAEKDIIAPSLEVQSSLAASNVGGDAANPTINENALNQVPANEEPTPAFRAPVDDTQDLFNDSEPISATIIADDDEKPNYPSEEDFTSSLHTMNLKLDSGPVDDSSSEEDNDKENYNPHPCGVADDSSPDGDPVKNFIDEEAEEEDDSDNDQNRFQENEADEDLDDIEELKDMIATGYEERATDKEKRNELHQKWLEQQDAAGTDNLMQRLKCGSVLKDAFLSDNEPETDEDDEMDEEIDDEAEEESLPKESGRINIKKAKQIILELYSGKEDNYLSDDDGDDDDMQRQRVQCLIRKEEQAQIALPADDASSREVFGLIKNLNIASDNKRKPKAFSIFDSVLKGGSSAQSSKSSFLGRASNHHIPSSHKQGSATVRSFIFGRDDSNSRSSMTISEEGSSDSVSRENRPSRNITTKYSSSQTKFINQTTDSGVEAASRTSLLEVLKRSSSRSKGCNEENAVDLTKSIFGFRAPKKIAKIQGRS